MPDVPGEPEVVGTALADHDPVPLGIDLGIVGQRRVFEHQIGALDEHIGCREADAGPALRVDGKEADVGPLLRDGGHGLGRDVHRDQVQLHPQQAGEAAGQIDRDTSRLGTVGLTVGQQGVAEVDDGAQAAGGDEFCDEGGIIDGSDGHGWSPCI